MVFVAVLALSKVFTIGGCLIFIIIGSAMVTTLTSIEANFKSTASRFARMSEYVLDKNLTKVQCRYQCVCQVVNRFHQKFEWIFMSHVTFVLIDGINLIALVAIWNNFPYNLFSIILWSIEPITFLWLITLTADRIKTKVPLETLAIITFF